MAALGRILQVVGWLWIVAGFVTPAFGLPNISPFPGFVVVFVARVLRNQAERSELPELGEGAGVEERPTPASVEPPVTPERPMNTERREPPRSAPEPAVIYEEPEPRQPRKRNELLEQIVGAGREVEAEATPSPSDTEDGIDMDPGTRRTMSSAEMIARAHERWDSKKR